MTRPMTVRAPPASESPPSPPSAAVAVVAFAERPRNRWSDGDDGDAENIAIEWRRLMLVDNAAPGHDINAEAAAAEEDVLLLCTARADAKQRASSPREERMRRDGRRSDGLDDASDERGMGLSACARGVFVFGCSFRVRA